MIPAFRARTARLLVMAAIATFGPAAVRAGETTSPETGSKPIPTQLAGLRDRWQAAMEEFSVPGFAVAVVRDDEIIYLDTFGLRDIERKLPVTPDTAYYIASCTKPFTAMALLTLVQDGKVGLDDPVRKHLPRFELPAPADSASITIRDILCHRPGIDCGPAVFLDAYTGEITDERYFRLLREKGTLSGKPTYSNIHFTLAGRVIESASGKPWRDLLAERIFRPAGMKTATGYADEMYARADVAIPYELGASGLAPATQRKTDATMHAAGGLGMSIHDLARWLRLNLNGGVIDGKRIISAEHAALMQSVQAEAQRGQIRVVKGFGLGWMVGTFRKDGPKYCMHSGGYVGSSAHTSFLPEQRIAVAVVTNAGPPAAMFAESLVSIDVLDRFAGGGPHADFLEELRRGMAENLPRMKREAARAAQSAIVSGAGRLSLPMDAYCGEFRDPLFGTLRVEPAGESLSIRIGALRTTLLRCQDDALTLLVEGNERQAKFELAGRRVTGVALELESGTVRFIRP